MTLNVLGREIEGRIANLRKVDFTTGGQNFVLVLSPGLIDKAPHSFLATVRVATGRGKRHVPGGDRPLPQYLHRAGEGRHRPGATPCCSNWRQGIRAASLVTILAGLLVLAGTIAAGARTRLYDATVLKVVGATRAQIALVYVFEYGVLGVATGFVALAAGTLAALLVARQVLDVSFVFDAGAVLVTVAGGGAATLLFGLMGALAALRRGRRRGCAAAVGRLTLFNLISCNRSSDGLDTPAANHDILEAKGSNSWRTSTIG